MRLRSALSRVHRTMTALPVDELLAPVADGAPSGPDLAYDAQFMALEVAARGKPERQAGNDVLPAEPPQWADVHGQALALAQRTRDVRLAVLLARAGAHTAGLKGYAAGLALVHGLLERQWDSVHPQLDAADSNDPTMRLNALAPLASDGTGLADLRATGLGRAASGLTARVIELAWSKAEALPGETKPAPAGVLDALRAAAAADDGLVPTMRAVQQAAAGIEQTIAERAGPVGPDFKGLRRIADALALAAAQLDGASVGASVNAPAANGSAPMASAAATAGDIASRDDVLRTLDRVCDWIERHEPSNPAPLLIRRAQRLMSKSFIDLVRDLAPEGLTQVERIAGVADS
jgi:type VI secretion system protein ImpA